MKSIHALSWLSLSCLAVVGMQVHAQERIYRCGNEYTNHAELAKSRGCSVMEGGNITIVQGLNPSRNADNRASASPAPGPAAGTAPAAAARSGADRIAPAEQRARDSDARTILEDELRRAEERLAQAQKAYANGEPEKQATESRNHQRYLDRVAELKAAVARAQSDVEGLRRELARLGVAPPPAGAASR